MIETIKEGRATREPGRPGDLFGFSAKQGIKQPVFAHWIGLYQQIAEPFYPDSCKG